MISFFEISCNNNDTLQWQTWNLNISQKKTIKYALKKLFTILPNDITIIKIEHTKNFSYISQYNFNWLNPRNQNKKINHALHNSNRIVWIYTQKQKMEYTVSKYEE